jgi:striatin 1/3/4
VRTSKLRALLGLKPNSGNSNGQATDPIDILTSATNALNNNQLDPLNSIINGNKQLLQFSSNKKSPPSLSNNTTQLNGSLNTTEVEKMLKLTESDANSMLMMTNLDLITNQIDSRMNNNMINKQTDEDEEMSEEEQHTSVNTKLINQNGVKQQQQQQVNDSDTENALNEFSFLTNEPSSDDQSDWNYGEEKMSKLKEEYIKDRKAKTKQSQSQSGAQQQQSLTSHTVSSQRPNRNALQAMIANLNESNEQQKPDTIANKIDASSDPANNSSSTTTSQKLNSFSFPNSPKIFEDDAFASDASLGELSRISVNNSNISLSGINDETIIDANQRKAITTKFSLRGHFDSIRCLAFHPNDSVLITGSEDQTIKLWNLERSSLSNKK